MEHYLLLKHQQPCFSRMLFHKQVMSPLDFCELFLCPLSLSLSQYCLHLTGSMFCLPDNLDLIIVMSSQSKSKDCIQFMQAAISPSGFIVIQSK